MPIILSIIFFLTYTPFVFAGGKTEGGSDHKKEEKKEDADLDKVTGDKKVSKPEKSHGGSHGQEKKEEKKHEAPEAPGHKLPPGYIKVPTVTIPIVQKKGLQAYYAMTVVLEMNKESQVAEVEKVMPYVRSAIFSDMYGLLSVVWDENYSPDLESLKIRLLGVIQESLQYPLGPDYVKNIYIRDFFKHR
jgi:flagellar basal body-associated protein FliL